MFTCPLIQFDSFCQISELLLSARSCARVCFAHLVPLTKKSTFHAVTDRLASRRSQGEAKFRGGSFDLSGAGLLRVSQLAPVFSNSF